MALIKSNLQNSVLNITENLSNNDFTWDNTTGTLYTNADFQIRYNTTWASGITGIFKKRRRFLGRGDERLEAKTFFKILKKGLKREVTDKFKILAEKAFDEALKAEKIGADCVKRELEKKLEFFLKKAAIQASGYTVFATNMMIEKYRKHLPCKKELIIDEISEYEKPLPTHAQIKLTKAKNNEIFDSFWIFWIREVKDPILFGQIDEETGIYYFIDQWDKDIQIDDLLKYK